MPSRPDQSPRTRSCGDWIVQRRCPHLRADLTKTGKIEDGVLTCSLHDWKWGPRQRARLTPASGHGTRVDTAGCRRAPRQATPVRPVEVPAQSHGAVATAAIRMRRARPAR